MSMPSSSSAQLVLRQFSLAEIKKATNNFDQSMVLRKGSMFEVYKGTYDDYDGKPRIVAIKAFKSGTGFQQELNTWFEQELKVWTQYRHEHVVLVIGYCRELGWNIIVYQHMVNGSLANNLCKKITPTSFYLSWEQCLHICIDAARGLEYIHAHNNDSEDSKFHLVDVAATNILLDGNGVAKICDLYKYEQFEGSYSPSFYFDPEFQSTGFPSQSSDVYAFGVLLVKVLSRKVFFDKEDLNLGIWLKKCIVNGTIHDQIIHREMKAEIPPHCLTYLVGIAGECLNDVSTKRPSISQVVKKLELLMASSSWRSCYKYSFHEIEDVTNNFESILGEGGEGIVYKGMTKTNTSFAVKRLKPGLSSEFQKEITMLSDLYHPNIVSLVGYCQESDQNILIYELMSNGNLAQSLYNTSNSLPWMQRLKICIGAARGLRYLHTRTNISPKGIIHRDVKPVNILLDDNLDAKIADFGLSKMSHQHQANSEITTTIKGTSGYYAPEYQCYRKITRKIDVYGFGIVLSEVLCKKKPWDREESFYPSENEKYGQWAKENIDPDLKGLIAPKCLEAFVNMLEKCLNMNPNIRPTMNDVVSGLEDAMKWQEAWQRHKSGGDFCIPGGEDRVILYCTSNSQSSIKLEPAMEKLKFPSDNFLKDFYIPDYILVPGSNVEVLHDVPSSPILVFINSKSGGKLGGDLLVTYRSLLNKNQVVDLGEVAPDRVLLQLYLTLESLKANGDGFALKIQQKLRIIVAGGDGTAGWLLGVVSDLKLSHPPPIATVPLGTGNNLPFAFGWGKKNPGTDRNAVLSFLEQVLKAKEMKIDSWHLLMRMKVPKNGPCDPLAPLELPHSLHAFHHVSSTDDLNKEGYDTFRGGFWNYFSMGMDSQVNQSTYAKLQGWFMASAFHPSSRNIAQLAKVKIMKRQGEWQDLHIPHSIRSIICLNLPSFSGGLNPWGTPNKNKTRDRNLTPSFVDDGLLEVVGFRDAWHGLVLIAPKGHGTRLAQAHRIRFEFHKAAADFTYMRIDGEPWKQPLPANDDTVVVEISHLGQVKMLATHDCRSKSVYDPSCPSSHGADEDDSDEEEDSVAEGEEWRKFGAADSFRIPDEVDISHLS